MKTITLTDEQADALERWQELIHEPDPSPAELERGHRELMQHLGQIIVNEVADKKVSELTTDELLELLDITRDLQMSARARAKRAYKAAADLLETVQKTSPSQVEFDHVSSAQEVDAWAASLRRYFIEGGRPFLMVLGWGPDR